MLQNFSYWVCFSPLPALFGGLVGSWAPSTPLGSLGRPPLMWAQAEKESLKEDSLTDLGSHFYGNQVARAECLILFWAVVATNYRQLYVPLLFPRKVSIYLLARFIYFPPPFGFYSLLSLHPLGKKKSLLYLGDVCFPGCYGDEKPDYRASRGWEEWAAGPKVALGPAGDGWEAEGADLGLRHRTGDEAESKQKWEPWRGRLGGEAGGPRGGVRRSLWTWPGVGLP